MTPTVHTRLRDAVQMTNPGEKAAFTWEGRRCQLIPFCLEEESPPHSASRPMSPEHGVVVQGDTFGQVKGK